MKARLLAGVIEKALVPGGDEENKNDEQNSTLHDQFHIAFRQLSFLTSVKNFADICAQFIAYGMFAASA
ncbi:MAG: hypothetical protein R2941_17065 [Desulfobacterales bacterium]